MKIGGFDGTNGTVCVRVRTGRGVGRTGQRGRVPLHRLPTPDGVGVRRRRVLRARERQRDGRDAGIRPPDRRGPSVFYLFLSYVRNVRVLAFRQEPGTRRNCPGCICGCIVSPADSIGLGTVDARMGERRVSGDTFSEGPGLTVSAVDPSIAVRTPFAVGSWFSGFDGVTCPCPTSNVTPNGSGSAPSS